MTASKFSVTPDQVTDTQLDEIESDQVAAALLPFLGLQLREILLRPEHQAIDKFTRDQLLTSSFDPKAKKRAKKRAKTLVTSFRQFIEDKKDEIEAISILYSRPYAAGLRYSQIKDLARRLSIKPFPDALASPVDEQMQWLVAIKDHIASSLMIEQDDFEYAPFNQFVGIGRAYELFGDELTRIMEELNTRLAA